MTWADVLAQVKFAPGPEMVLPTITCTVTVSLKPALKEMLVGVWADEDSDSKLKLDTAEVVMDGVVRIRAFNVVVGKQEVPVVLPEVNSRVFAGPDKTCV
jgi:hypothetical protein